MFITLIKTIIEYFYIIVPVFLISLVVQLSFLRKAQDMKFKLIPVYILIIVFVLAIWSNNGSGLGDAIVAIVLFVLIGIPGLVGNIIAWIIYGYGRLADAAENPPPRSASITKKVKKEININKYYPCGMISVFFYLLHFLFDRLLWLGYQINPVLISACTYISGVFLLVFAVAIIIKAYRDYHSALMISYLFYFIAMLAAIFGFGLFILTGNVEMNGQTAHYTLTSIIIFSTLILLYLLTIGYLAIEKMTSLGILTLIASVVATVFGIMYCIDFVFNKPHTVLTSQFVFYTQLVYVFCLSYAFTFRIDKSK